VIIIATEPCTYTSIESDRKCRLEHSQIKGTYVGQVFFAIPTLLTFKLPSTYWTASVGANDFRRNSAPKAGYLMAHDLGTIIFTDHDLGKS
jgi:hypothetical protein